MERKDSRQDDSKKRGAVPKKLLKDIIKERREASKKKSLKPRMEEPSLYDPFKQTNELKDTFRKKTAYAYLPSERHASPWDPNFPECPARAKEIHEAILPILPRLEVIETADMIDEDDIKLISSVHPREHIESIKNLCATGEESDAQIFDSIFFNGEASFNAAKQAVKMAVTLCKLVAEDKYQNGFANIRPPGHHALPTYPNGYCLFNNVAIAAKYLLRKQLAEKILIVDVDVHHGQGTQKIFYESTNVLYFSIHRYEYGKFWPNLPESSFEYIGQGDGVGYNINVPLNETGLGDFDYLAIIINVLLPVAYEFNPDIILISAGYDACLGCPEGQMNVTPAFYGHLITLLSGIAKGKIAAILEGGYFLPSLSDAVLRTIKGLLGDPCHKLEQSRHINPSVKQSIHDVKMVLRPFWRCFNMQDRNINVEEICRYDRYTVDVKKYYGTQERPPYPTRDCYPKNKIKQEAMYLAQLDYIKTERYNTFTNTVVGFLYNEKSAGHNPPAEQRAQETQKRLVHVLNKLKEFSLLEKMTEVEYEFGEEDSNVPIIWPEVWSQIVETHSPGYVYGLDNVPEEQKPDLYMTKDSRYVCQWSVTILCYLARKIKRGTIYHGVGIIRPPGHHAKFASGGGFCLVNNVVIAANYIINKLHYKKVLILDFDVHHGDGTQSLTYKRDDIMYISMHRYDDAQFFPKDLKSNYTFIGEGKATGFNINIPFNGYSTSLENADYLYVWLKLVVPLSYSFNPDIILVSAGFDAGINDPLGRYNIYPEVFGHFIQLIKPIAPIILALEGGYNLETTAMSMVNCVRALLGEPIVIPMLDHIKEPTEAAVTNVLSVAQPHWPILEVNKINLRAKKQYDLDEMARKVTRM